MDRWREQDIQAAVQTTRTAHGSRSAKPAKFLFRGTLLDPDGNPVLIDQHVRGARGGGCADRPGQASADFERELESNLQSLIDRAQSGRYRVPAIRRVLIPKGDGQTRPIGIPAHEERCCNAGRDGLGDDLRAGLSCSPALASGG